ALAAGDEIRIKVFYEPTRPGAATATYRIQTSALRGDVLLQFGGTAQQYAPCSLEVKPSPVLDFGTLPPGQGAVLGLRLRNIGQELCAVKNVPIADDAGGVFFMPGGTLDGVLMSPGDYFSFQVAARRQAAGGKQFLGRVELQPSAAPVRAIPLLLN